MTMLRSLAFALCLATLPAIAPAQTPSIPSNDAAAATPSTQQTSPDDAAADGDFIRETRIYFPQSLDHFFLENSRTAPDVSAGVSLRYGYDGTTFPIDVYVYPIGRLSETEALDLGMDELLTSFEQAEKLGYYRDVDLSRPRASEVPLNPFVTIPVRQVTYTAVINGAEVVSHSLLAYRSYYLFKVRITAPENQKHSARDVERKVMQTLLPALHLSHTGSCAKHNQITAMQAPSVSSKEQRVSADGSQVLLKKGRENGHLLIEAVMRKADSTCVSNFDKEEIKHGEKFETLQFPAGSWQDPAAKTEAAQK